MSEVYKYNSIHPKGINSSFQYYLAPIGSSMRGCATLPYGMKNEDCKNDEHFVRHCFCTSDLCNFENHPKSCHMQGYTWINADIIYPILQTSYQDCFEKCLQNENCLAWTWYTSNRLESSQILHSVCIISVVVVLGKVFFTKVNFSEIRVRTLVQVVSHQKTVH